MTIDKIIIMSIMSIGGLICLYNFVIRDWVEIRKNKKDAARESSKEDIGRYEEIIMALKLQGYLNTNNFKEDIISMLQKSWWIWKIHPTRRVQVDNDWSELVEISHPSGLSIEIYYDKNKKALDTLIQKPYMVWLYKEDAKEIAIEVNNLLKNRALLMIGSEIKKVVDKS